MSDYNSIISLISKIDKDWEDLPSHDKEILVNLYIDNKIIITIPCETKMKESIIHNFLKLNIENIELEDLDEVLSQDLICATTNMQNLILQGIEDSIESDLDEEDFKSTETKRKE